MLRVAVRKQCATVRIVGLPLLYLCVLVTGALAEQLPIRTYTTADGLGHNRVKRIVQDSHGFLWFCTAGGLSRFDGYKFINYTVEDGLPAPSINDLLETQDGVYWVATNSIGVIRFNVLAGSRSPSAEPPASRFTVYPVSDEPVSNRVNLLYKDNAGLIWAGTDGGLFYLDETNGASQFRRVQLGIPSHPDIEVQVWALAEDNAGSLWIGTTFGLVRRFSDGRIIHYAIQPSDKRDTVLALLVDKRGMLWVGHQSGLITFHPESASTSAGKRTVSLALPGDARRYTTSGKLVQGLCQTSDGSIWIVAFGGLLMQFDREVFHTYMIAQRAGDRLGVLVEDRVGNLWTGTDINGALKITRHGLVNYGVDDGLGQNVSSVFENRAGELYVSSSVWRISHFDGTKFTTVRPNLPRSVTDESWRHFSGFIEDHTGEWWIGTREGLCRFPKVNRFEQLARTPAKAIYTTRDGLANNDVTRLFEDSRGDIWIASFVPSIEVVTRWDRETGTFHRYSETDGLRPFTSVNSFSEDAMGGVWMGFREGGLARYKEGRFTLLGSNDGLPTTNVNRLYLDRAGKLWAALSLGLLRIDNPAADRPRFIIYTRTEGLTTNLMMDVTGDLAGNIYASSNRGIDRLDPATGHIKHYSLADGLSGGEIQATFSDRTGALWFGTNKGLSRLIPEPERPLPPPLVFISGLRMSGEAFPVSELGETDVSGLELGAEQNNIEIDFFAVAFGAGDAPHYQYKLEGAHSDWGTPTDQRVVNYANLAPGTYRFLVRAMGADGTLSESPAMVGFRVLPPIWRRWWFVTIATLIIASAAFAFAWSRYGRLKALRESENRFRTLAETASDAIITIDEDSRIVLVNHAAERIFGYTMAEMLGQELTMLMPDYLRHLHKAGFDRYKVTGKRHISWEAIELPGLHKNGSEVPLELSFGEFIRKNKRYFTGIARDITERKRADEALRQSREERLAELERVRRRIATDLHDDIGSSLTQISLLSEVMQTKVDHRDSALTEGLSMIAGASRELVDSMSDIVWAINPQKDHLSDLTLRMRRFASDVFTARNIQFRLTEPDEEHDVRLGANIRREVFLIFKESVNNLARHSGCTSVDINFQIAGERLALSVSDNGKGFDLSRSGDGHGLTSMRERAKGIGGNLEITSTAGKGTTVYLEAALGSQIEVRR